MTTRMPRRVLEDRQAVRDLEAALGALTRAMQATADPFVAETIEKGRKRTGEALRRARIVLGDSELRNAPQPELELGNNQPGETR